MTFPSRYLALGIAGLVIANCAPSQQAIEPDRADLILAARAQLIDALGRCKEAHSYDPATMIAVDERALALNEPAWRQCAYDALRAYQNPDMAVRQQIESLIVEDIAMTAAVQQRTMTRSQRKARNLKQIEAIKALEEAQARAATAAQAQHDAQVRQVVEGLRGFAH